MQFLMIMAGTTQQELKHFAIRWRAPSFIPKKPFCSLMWFSDTPRAGRNGLIRSFVRFPNVLVAAENLLLSD